MTKREIMEAYDRGVALSAGPVANVWHDGRGRACGLGAIGNGVRGKRLLGGWLSSDVQTELGFTPQFTRMLHNHFDANPDFAEFRAHLDKQLTRLVDRGEIEEG